MAATWVVTAANRGLGLEFARQLSARGERVIATARDLDAASDLGSLGVEMYPLDVTDADSVVRFGEEVAAEAIDVLINNAGIGVQSKSFESLDFAEMELFFEVNSIGPLRVTRALLPRLRAGAGKKIVNITSRMGSISDNDSGAAYPYRASKAALNMVTRSLAIDLRSEDIICTVLHPGWVQTDMGGKTAPVTTEDSIAGMLRVIDGLSADDSGEFYDFTGARVPW